MVEEYDEEIGRIPALIPDAAAASVDGLLDAVDAAPVHLLEDAVFELLERLAHLPRECFIMGAPVVHELSRHVCRPSGAVYHATRAVLPKKRPLTRPGAPGG
jgi:hypothetical protein